MFLASDTGGGNFPPLPLAIHRLFQPGLYLIAFCSALRAQIVLQPLQHTALMQMLIHNRGCRSGCFIIHLILSRCLSLPEIV